MSADRGTAELLRVACAAMGSVLKVQRQRVCVIQGPNRLDAVAEWGLMPGAVSVFSAPAGTLLVRSMPGEPLKRDRSADHLTCKAFRAGTAWGLDADEQAAALEVAAARLAMSVDPHSVALPVRDVPRHLWPHEATWCWPGVLRVVDRFTGQAVAVWKPARPAAPARASRDAAAVDDYGPASWQQLRRAGKGQS